MKYKQDILRDVLNSGMVLLNGYKLRARRVVGTYFPPLRRKNLLDGAIIRHSDARGTGQGRGDTGGGRNERCE